MLFIPKAINAKSLLHQLNPPLNCPCIPKLQLSARAMLFSKWHNYMRRSDEGDAMLELVADLESPMLIHVKIIRRIIVLCKQLDEADGFC
jgi:hypothetical protein